MEPLVESKPSTRQKGREGGRQGADFTSVKAADLPPPDLEVKASQAAAAAINAAEVAMPAIPTIDLEAGEQLDQMFQEPPELQEASLVETARRQWMT
eukprot:958180-Amphidinium_carterae.1